MHNDWPQSTHKNGKLNSKRTNGASVWTGEKCSLRTVHCVGKVGCLGTKIGCTLCTQDTTRWRMDDAMHKRSYVSHSSRYYSVLFPNSLQNQKNANMRRRGKCSLLSVAPSSPTAPSPTFSVLWKLSFVINFTRNEINDLTKRINNNCSTE